jgi:hypothetical protein
LKLFIVEDELSIEDAVFMTDEKGFLCINGYLNNNKKIKKKSTQVYSTRKSK